jgi:hypothetical protein
MTLVSLVVLVIAGFVVYRLHGAFIAHSGTPAAGDDKTAIVPISEKHVELQVFGAPGAVATINYLDVNAQPQRVDNVTLPWSYTITSTDTAIVGNVVAQGDGDSIGCRILVDGVVKDERSFNAVNAYTFCLDKSG